jgi:hypothetical protein
MIDNLPTSVRYVKNGSKGRWWTAAREREQVHLGWMEIPASLLLKPNYAEIERRIRKFWDKKQGLTELGKKGGATQDFNQLCALLKAPSQHMWITFEDGFMWWCTVRDGAIPNPAGESKGEGHFSLECDRPWSNRSLKGKLLAYADLPGTVTRTAGFQGTVCEPKAADAVQRIIRGEKDPKAVLASKAREEYERTTRQMVAQLSWKDFEQLVDLILARSGWVRICTLGGKTEGIDVEVENLAAAEIAFVQVKSSANQGVLNDYVKRFKARRDYYARMIFAVHSPSGKLIPPKNNPSVQIWEDERIANLVVRLGLGEWVEGKIA